MPQKGKEEGSRVEQGRQLARRLYSYKLAQLEHLSSEEQARLQSEFPMLGKAEFQDVLQQVVAAKRYEQERIGWLAVPHDVAVLMLVLLTVALNLQAGIVAGVAILVLLESLFQFFFNQRLYRFLGMLVWLTYPAYVLLAYVLYRRGFKPLWVVAAVLFAWIGTFLLGTLARLLTRLFLEARVKAGKTPQLESKTAPSPKQRRPQKPKK